MANLSFDILNLTKAVQSLAEMGERVIPAAYTAAHHEANLELDMVRPNVPVDTGNLRASGRVEDQVKSNSEISVGIVYGGPAGSGPGQDMDVDYAIYVHEDLEAQHKVGKAKFLEDVVRQQIVSGRASDRMAAEIRARLGL